MFFTHFIRLHWTVKQILKHLTIFLVEIVKFQIRPISIKTINKNWWVYPIVPSLRLISMFKPFVEYFLPQLYSDTQTIRHVVILEQKKTFAMIVSLIVAG